jgi:oxygen-dependent protoporphyrinogen oxidase
LACPSHISAELIRAFSPQTAAALAHIPFAPVDVVCHGYATESVDHPLHGFGVLIPRGEGKRMLGSLWCDSIFPGQAPRGHHLIRSILGGAHDAAIRDLNLDQLETTVQAENAALLGVHGTPDFRRVIRHERGIAQYTVGHLARVAVADKLESELPGLFFTGASYRGVSVNGCIKDAFALAERFWKGWMN